MTLPTTIAELYPRTWLRADDLGGRGIRVTIAATQVQSFRRPNGESKQAIVLSFTSEGRPCARRLICNKTQAVALGKLTGSECFADWMGAEVLLSPATAPNGKATIAVQAVPAAPDT